MTHVSNQDRDDLLSWDIADAQLWEAVDRMDLTGLCDVLGAKDNDEIRALATVLSLLSVWRQRRKPSLVLPQWGYRAMWRPATLEKAPVQGRWLLVVPANCKSNVITSCSAALADLGAEVAQLNLTVDTTLADLTAGLRDALAEPTTAGVISMLGLDERPHEDHPQLSAGLVTTVSLVQALAAADRRIPLWFVTNGANLSRHQAHVWGLSRVVATEHPDLRGGIADLCGPVGEQSWPLLAAALTNRDGEDQLLVRATGLSVRRLVRIKQIHATGKRWNLDGTVLITGGTGRLGTRVAHALAAHGVRHLLLASRSGPEDAGVPEARRELAGLGAQVTVAACDVTDRSDLTALLAAIPRDRPLTAVVHAAGVRQSSAVGALSPSQLDAVLRPRSLGAWLLHELTKDLDLQGFVLFGSTAGICGTRGQAGQAAADAYLCALAEHRRDNGLAGIAVMAGLVTGANGTRVAALRAVRRTGMRPLGSETLAGAVGEVLGHEAGAVLLADIDWDRFLPMSGGGTLFDDIPEVLRLRRRRTDPALPGVLAEMSDVERHRALLNVIRDHVAQVAGHGDVSSVDVRRTFRELGFDSAGAVEFRNRLAAATGLALPASLVFDHPTPRALAGFLLSGVRPDGGDRPDEVGRTAGAAVLASATDDEMFAFIEHELGIQ